MPSGMAGMGGPKAVVTGAGYALALLLSINLFNYIDRQILSATLPKIRLDATILRPDDPWATTKLGGLATAFMVSYMLLSPVFGRLGDTRSRWGLIGVAVMVWSLATGGTGLATGYVILLLTRCLVGVGESAYGPVAPAMISDLYPIEHRGRVLSWFYVAIPVGSALGFVIGSQVAETSLGWRGAFLIAVIPGVILGALCFRMKEPPRGGTDVNTPAAPAVGYSANIRELARNKSYVLCCAGMTASTFVLGGVAVVMQLYLYEREARFTLDEAAIRRLSEDAAFRLSDGSQVVPPNVIAKLTGATGPDEMTIAATREKLQKVLTKEENELYSSWIFDAAPTPNALTNGKIGLYFGGIVVIAGLVATLVGGATGDWLRARGVRGAYFHVAGWGTIAGFPFFFATLYVPFPLGWVFLFLAVFTLFFNTGPANTILANVTRPSIRATAFAINILLIHALGDAISPLIIGFLSDLTSLQTAFLLVSFLIPVAGIFWVMGARYLDEDTQRAETAEDEFKV